MRRKRTWFYKKTAIWLLCACLLCSGCGTEYGRKAQKGTAQIEKDTDINTEPLPRKEGGKYRIAYVDYDEYLPASRQLYYILKGLREMGWITCEQFPFTAESNSTKEMVEMLAEMDLGEYLEFSAEAFYYLGYEGESKIREELYRHSEEKKDIDLVLVFGTSAGKLVKDLGLSVPMVDFSATDPVASGIIDSAENSGSKNVWAQVEPSMPLRQLKYYHSIQEFKRLGIVVYGDETISGVPDIEAAAEEVGFQIRKRNLPELARETEEEKEAYYQQVQRELSAVAAEGIDAFFLTVDLINDLDRLEDLLTVFYENKIPVYVMDDAAAVERGALMIISTYDFENVGYFIADAVARILNGAAAGELPCVYTSAPYICFNYRIAQEIGYPLDFKFLASCDEIYQ